MEALLCAVCSDAFWVVDTVRGAVQPRLAGQCSMTGNVRYMYYMYIRYCTSRYK